MRRFLTGKVALLAGLIFTLALPGLAGAVPQKGKNLPAFEATAVDGKKVSPATYAGKVLLLSVTSDSCDACKKATPRFNELLKNYGKQGFQILGLHYGSHLGVEELKALIKSYGVGFPMAITDEKTVKNTLGLFGVPCYLLLDKKGKVVALFRGFNETNYKLIEKQVKMSLAE